MFLTKLYIKIYLFSIKDDALFANWTQIIQNNGESVNYRNEREFVSTIQINRDRQIKQLSYGDTSLFVHHVLINHLFVQIVEYFEILRMNYLGSLAEP